MDGFVGRRRYLSLLEGQLPTAGKGGTPGRALLLRGRRRVGKTRLVETFITQSDIPSVFFTASGQPDAIERQLFAEAVTTSSLPRAQDFGEDTPATWEDALRRLCDILPDSPSVIVMDEVPFLMENNPHFEGTLQKVFDRFLSRKPTLFIGIGSNEAVMRGMDAHDRPFHGRATPLEVHPLNPHDLSTHRQNGPREAIDAWLLSGGMPLIIKEWEPTEPLTSYLDRALSSPLSALVVTGERALAAEVATDLNQKLVIQALAGKAMTFSKLSSITGLPSSSLDRTLSKLGALGVITGERPYSTTTSRLRHYRVTDSYLSFWLDFILPYAAEIDRGRGNLTSKRALLGWKAWRGKQVESLVRESILRSDRFSITETETHQPLTHVGSYWTRNYRTEVDIVGGDRSPVADSIHLLGSIKWRETSEWRAHDTADLHQAASEVPGASDAKLMAVTPDPVTLPEGIIGFTATDVVEAWA